MANDNQHLKHGKALCGKVFGNFVETFNALVDFMLGLKGDADGKNGEGHINYDRKNRIIRCKGCREITANEQSGIVINEKYDSGGGGKEIDLAEREEQDTFAIHTMTVKKEDAEDEVIKFLGTGDVVVPEGDAKAGVESVNDADGKLHIIGGKGIDVETDGKTIKITANPDKEEEDPDPQDPEEKECQHDDTTGKTGGVNPEKGERHGGGGGGGGGVNPDKDDPAKPHPGDDPCQGDPNCNC